MLLLDDSRAVDIANDLISNLEFDGGYTTGEAIPGLVQAIIVLVKRAPEDIQDGLLDEAMTMLDEGGIDNVYDEP